MAPNVCTVDACLKFHGQTAQLDGLFCNSVSGVCGEDAPVSPARTSQPSEPWTPTNLLLPSVWWSPSPWVYSVYFLNFVSRYCCQSRLPPRFIELCTIGLISKVHLLPFLQSFFRSVSLVKSWGGYDATCIWEEWSKKLLVFLFQFEKQETSGEKMTGKTHIQAHKAYSLV